MPLLSLGLQNLEIILDMDLPHGVVADTFFILLEDGSFLLQEDGFKFKQEIAP